MDKDKLNYWVTVQDCIGIPCFPSGAANVRNKLENLLSGNQELKRKRDKSKGYEYHISILPKAAQDHFGVMNLIQQHDFSEEKHENMNENAKIWQLIYQRMNEEQQQIAIDTFITGGLNALLPSVMQSYSDSCTEDKEILLSNQTESPGYQLSQSSINTAEILHKLTAEQRREILQKYEIDEGDSKNTINQTVTQHKKEAS